MSEIQIKVHKGLAVITLARPQALNALSLDMIKDIRTVLSDMRDDDDIKAVMFTSENEKAFCAGGDVKSVAMAAKNTDFYDANILSDNLCYEMFYEEYNLNHEIADYPKCIISLIDGICMGGGAGLALHGDFTVVSNAVKFAMPEVFIGFFPDVGSGYIFNKLPRPTALWLLLTGARISGQMMHGLGLATHYIESRGIQALYKTLLQSDWRRSEAISILKSQLATYCEPPDSKQMPEGMSSADVHKKAESYFDADNVPSILQNLQAASDDQFALQALESMQSACPESMVLTLQHMDWARGKDVATVLENEFRLAQYFVRQPDFYEGVRAVLIEKDGNPQWSSRAEDFQADHYGRIQERYDEYALFHQE